MKAIKAANKPLSSQNLDLHEAEYNSKRTALLEKLKKRAQSNKRERLPYDPNKYNTKIRTMVRELEHIDEEEKRINEE